MDSKEEAVEYIKNVFAGIIPRHHPDFENGEANLVVAVEQIWDAAYRIGDLDNRCGQSH